MQAGEQCSKCRGAAGTRCWQCRRSFCSAECQRSAGCNAKDGCHLGHFSVASRQVSRIGADAEASNDPDELDPKNITRFLQQVFDFLNHNDRANARLVSKQWRDTIDTMPDAKHCHVSVSDADSLYEHLETIKKSSPLYCRRLVVEMRLEDHVSSSVVEEMDVGWHRLYASAQANVGYAPRLAIHTGDFDIRSITQLFSLPGLVEFSGNRVTVHADAIDALKTPHRLVKLSVHDSRVSNAMLERLGEIGTLQHLDLSRSRIGEAGATALATALAQNTSLQHLNLIGNVVGEAGATALATALAQNTSLQHLDIRGNGIRDVGATALAAALAQNTSLQHLDLRGNAIGDAGAAALATELAQNTSLQHLDLYRNYIDDAVITERLRSVFGNRLEM